MSDIDEDGQETLYSDRLAAASKNFLDDVAKRTGEGSGFNGAVIQVGLGIGYALLAIAEHLDALNSIEADR